MRKPRAALLLLVLGLVACGRQEADRYDTAEPAAASAVSILLLDPAGRLLAPEHVVDLFLVSEGKATGLPTWPDAYVHALDEVPPAGTRLLVVAAGCRPHLTALAPGRNVVRLEAGFPVRLTLSGTRPALPGGTRLGLRLSQRVEALEGVTLPTNTSLRALVAAAFAEDLPCHPQYVAVPAAGVLDLLIPAPGPYVLEWDARAGNGSSSVHDDAGPFVLDPATDALAIDWATAAIGRATRFLRKER